MKLSNETITILRNFATIQPNIVVKANEENLSTISEAKNIVASADIHEIFDTTFGIYDLNEFIAAVSLIENPEIELGENSMEITSGDGSKSLTYFYASPEVLTYPEKAVKNPEYEVQLLLTHEVLNGIKKAAGIFGFDTFSITKAENSDEIYIEVCDPANKSSNVYSQKISINGDESEVRSIDCKVGGNIEDSFRFDFLISNLKCIPADFDVYLSSKLISCWVTKQDPMVTYWIAIERSSSYNKNNS